MGRRPLPKTRSLNAEKRNAWLKIILPHFSANGFSDVRMDELSTIVGVSKATFYKHFVSKEDLIQALLKWKIDEISLSIPVLMDNSINYYERYLKSTELSCFAVSGLSNAFLADLKLEYPELYKQVENFRNELVKIVGEFYKQAQRDGFIRADLDIKILAMTEDLVYERAADPDFLSRYDSNLEEFLAKYIHFRSMAILTNYNEETAIFFKNLISRLK